MVWLTHHGLHGLRIAKRFSLPSLLPSPLFAAFFAITGGTVLLNILSYISYNPSQLWRILSVGFLVLYRGYSFTSRKIEAGIMLNMLHLIVAVPSLILIKSCNPWRAN